MNPLVTIVLVLFVGGALAYAAMTRSPKRAPKMAFLVWLSDGTRPDAKTVASLLTRGTVFFSTGEEFAAPEGSVALRRPPGSNEPDFTLLKAAAIEQTDALWLVTVADPGSVSAKEVATLGGRLADAKLGSTTVRADLGGVPATAVRSQSG